jgi:hypothetical protein
MDVNHENGFKLWKMQNEKKKKKTECTNVGKWRRCAVKILSRLKTTNPSSCIIIFRAILYKPCVSLSFPKVKQLKGRRSHPTPEQLPFANYIHDMLDEADITTS